MKKLIFILVIIGLAWKFTNRVNSVSLGPGIKAPDTPEQVQLNPPRVFNHDDFNLTQMASFRLQAKVLSIENYHTGRAADLAPVDLALGWGPMSDEAVLDNIEITQSNRFYWWRTEQFPIPRREIETNSANMHLIPANDEIREAIKDIRIGDLVELTGYLVNASAVSDNWYWKTSLTRNDTGNGACELIWVEDLVVLTSSVN